MFMLAVLVAGTMASWRTGGALLAFFLAWLVATAPSALGIIEYNYSIYASNKYIYIILATLGAFSAGYGLNVHNSKRAGDDLRAVIQSDNFDFWRKPLPYIIALGIISIAMMIWNAYLVGLNVADLSNLRIDVTSQEGATVAAKIAVITTWACFICLAFAIYFRSRIPTLLLILLILVGSGALLSSFLSAGRQAIIQSIILTFIVYRSRRRFDALHGGVQKKSRLSLSGASFAAAAVFLIVYITIGRSQSLIIQDRSAFLLSIFDAHIPTNIDNFLASFGPDVYSFLVETILYLSHSVPLFSMFVDVPFPHSTYGQMSFPFVLRQLEPLTGLSVAQALQTKAQYLSTSGLFGVGWNTSLSQTIMDFGIFGSCVFFFIQGYISAYWSLCSSKYSTFGASVIHSVMVIAALYTPFLLSFSDTSVLLLFIIGSALFYIATYRSLSPARPPLVAV